METKTTTRTYVGTDKTVEELTEISGLIPVQFLEKTLPKVGYYQNELKLPGLAIIKKVSIGIKNTRYVNYSPHLNYTDSRWAYFQNDFPVRVLSGLQGEAMLQKYQEDRLENLSSEITGEWPYLGSDPEIFVEDEKGELIPAFTFLGAKSESSVYWDGFQAEFETNADTCLAYLVDSIQEGLRRTLNAAQAVNQKAKLSIRNVFEISPSVLRTTEHKYVELGCKPSLNAYGLNARKVGARELSFRPAGGHMHFGLDSPETQPMEQIVKSLDAILGVACVSLFASFDNPVRREFYGLPGEYRLPKHGLEYRTLSNAWLSHPAIAHLVFEVGRRAVFFGQQGFLPYWQAEEKETIETIKNCDVDQARKILDRNKNIFQAVLKSAELTTYNEGEYSTDTAFQTFKEGMETAIAEPDNIAKNWKISHGNWKSHSEGTHCNWHSSGHLIAAGNKV